MPNEISIWPVLPLAVSLVTAIAVLAAATLAAKRYGPFRSNLIAAIAVTGIVLLPGFVVYFSTQSYASREENRATKNWWELLDEGDAAGAEKKLVRQLKTLRNNYGKVDPDHSPYMFNLAQVYSKQGRLEEAEQLYLDTLELIRSDMTDHEQWYCDALLQTAVFYMDIGDYPAAEEHFLEGFEASRVEYGDDHGLTIRMLRGLAGCNRVQEDYEEAEQYYKELMSILERVGVDSLTSYGEVYADMLTELDRDEEAQSLRAHWTMLETEGDY